MKEEAEKQNKFTSSCENNESVEGPMLSLQKGNMAQGGNTKAPKMDIKDMDLVLGTDNKNSRYSKTVQVFQQTGLLECTLQTAKLCKENEKLQERINDLEKQVNEASRKARDDLKKHLKKD